MKKYISLTIILLVVIIVLGGCNAAQPTKPAVNQNVNGATIPIGKTPVINSSQPDYTPPPVKEVPPSILKNIQIQNFSFNPATLTIPIGATVVWTNNDSVPHAIAGTGFNSQTLNKGENFSYTFYQVGTYDYHCAIHPSMTGQIIVNK